LGIAGRCRYGVFPLIGCPALTLALLSWGLAWPKAPGPLFALRTRLSALPSATPALDRGRAGGRA
jgi:hypothetical protein